MSHRRFVSISWLLALLALASATAVGLESQCRERELEPGSVRVAGDSEQDKCWCGLLIQTDHRVCDTKLIATPDRYTCDGKPSEVIDCHPGGFVVVEERTYRCALVMASVTLMLFGTEISITFPVCVGTSCEATGSRPVDIKMTAMEIPCAAEEETLR